MSLNKTKLTQNAIIFGARTVRCYTNNGHHVIAQIIVNHVVVAWRCNSYCAAATISTQTTPMRVVIHIARIAAKVASTAVSFIHLLVVYVHSGHKIVFDARWVQSGWCGRCIG